MSDKDLIKYSNDIVTILSKLYKKSEVSNFVRDLLSENEIIEFSRRFEVAKMLDEKISYSLIEEKTNMSSTTIARISKFLKWDNFGYKNAISILKSVYEKHHTGHHS